MTTDFRLITVTPWNDGGRHRIYVSDQQRSLGFFDEGTGTVVLTDARHQPVVVRALRTAGYQHLADTDSAPTRDGEVYAADPDQVWADLVASRAPRTVVAEDWAPRGDHRRPSGTDGARRSAPHGWRDPTTTLTAMLTGDPSPDPRPPAPSDATRQAAAEVAALVDDPRWHVLEVDGTEIDHLLVGPGGVFTLGTKVHPGATVQVSCLSAVVDGTDHPWVHTALRAHRRAERALSQACHQTVTVTTLLVVDAGRLTTTLPPPVGVVVLERHDLRRWLYAQPETLTPGTVAMLADTARHSTTWYRGQSAA